MIRPQCVRHTLQSYAPNDFLCFKGENCAYSFPVFKRIYLDLRFHWIFSRFSKDLCPFSTGYPIKWCPVCVAAEEGTLIQLSRFLRSCIDQAST